MPLTLTRKPGEVIRLTVPPSTQPQIIDLWPNAWHGDQIRITINAARCVEIVRKELLPVKEESS